MAIDLLTALPDPPLPTDEEDVFDAKAGATLTAQQKMVNVDINGKLVPQINAATLQITTDKNAAAQSATAAVASATAAGQQVGLAAEEVTKASAQVQLAVAARTGSEAARDSSQNFAAAAGAAIGAPALTTNRRRPLVVNDAETGAVWARALSIPHYIDKSESSSRTGSFVLDITYSTVFDITLTGNASVGLLNLPVLNGESFTLVIRLRQGGTARTFAWFTNVTWLTPGGTAPPLPLANKITEYVFTTTDGSSWLGRKGSGN